MNDAIRSRLDGLQKLGLAAFVLGGLGLAWGWFDDREQFLRSYLYAFVVWIGLPLGSLALTMIHHLTGGFWGLGIARQLQAAMRTLPLFALLFVPIALGLELLYPWASEQRAVQAMGEHLYHHKHVYLNEQAFLLRALAYFLVCGGLSWLLLRNAAAWDRDGNAAADVRTRLISGPGIVLFALAGTGMAIDWGMSLEPGWFSTMYGVIWLVGMALTTLVFSILFTSRVRECEPYRSFARANLFHDLGTLTFALVMLWAYASFSQFLIIWSGNIAEETPWYLKRSEHGWVELAIALALLHFALPFLLLLMRRIKRDAALVPLVAALLLLMRHVDLYWQIKPSFTDAQGQHLGLALHWLDLAAPLAIGGLWLAVFVWRLKAHPLTSPRQEQQLAAALAPEH